MTFDSEDATARARQIAALWHDRPHLAKLDIIEEDGYRWVGLPFLADGPATIAIDSDGAIKLLSGLPGGGGIAAFFKGASIARGGDLVGRLLARPYNDLPGAVSFLRRVADRTKPGAGGKLDRAEAEIVMSEHLGGSAIYAAMRKAIPDFLARRIGAHDDEVAVAMEAEYNTCVTTLARDIVTDLALQAVGIDSEMTAGLPFGMMIAAEHSRVQYLMDRLISGFDYEVLCAMHLAGRGDDGLAYHWYAKSGEKAAWRRQAMRSYGMFAPDIARLSYLREKIDAGDSVQEWIKGIAPKEMAPLALKRVFARNPNLHGLSQSAFLSAVAEIQPDWVPKDSDEMQALADIIYTTAKLRAETGLPFADLVKESRGKWIALRTKLLSPPPARMPEGVTEAGVSAVLRAKEIFARLASIDHGLATAVCGKMSDGVTEKIMAAERAVRGDDIAQVNSTQVARWLSQQVCPVMDIHAASWTLSEAMGVARQFSHQVILPAAAATSSRSEIILSEAVVSQSLKLSIRAMFAGRSISYINDVLNKYHVGVQRATAIAMIVQPEVDQIAIDPVAVHPVAIQVDPIEAAAARLSAGFETPLKIGLDAQFVRKHWAPMFREPFMAYDKSGGKIAPDKDGGIVGAIYAIPLWYDTLLVQEGAADGVDRNGVPGLAMCVGWNGYDRKCLNGQHIVSFREYNGPNNYRRIACLELSEPRRMAGDLVEVRNLQFYGYRNSSNFERGTRVALDNFFAAVTSGVLPLNWDMIGNKSSFINHRGDTDRVEVAHNAPNYPLVKYNIDKGDAERIRDLAGYDFDNGLIGSAVLEAWRQIVPGLSGCRILGDIYRVMPDLPELSDAMSPQARSVNKVLSGLPKLMA